jgi:hypothetical protein
MGGDDNSGGTDPGSGGTTQPMSTQDHDAKVRNVGVVQYYRKKRPQHVAKGPKRKLTGNKLLDLAR